LAFRGGKPFRLDASDAFAKVDISALLIRMGATTTPSPAGQLFSGAEPITNPVTLRINNVSVTPSFACLSGPGLYQLNRTVPSGLGTGDVSPQATVGGVLTPAGVVISLQ
jgi:uncharacterized protein (TIGR03437 family)